MDDLASGELRVRRDRHPPIPVSASLLCATLIGAFAAGRAHAAQTHMVAARNHFRSARQELQQAMADKGGHREKAIGIVDRAIGEVNAGMEYARTH